MRKTKVFLKTKVEKPAIAIYIFIVKSSFLESEVFHRWFLSIYYAAAFTMCGKIGTSAAAAARAVDRIDAMILAMYAATAGL